MQALKDRGFGDDSFGDMGETPSEWFGYVEQGLLRRLEVTELLEQEREAGALAAQLKAHQARMEDYADGKPLAMLSN